MRSVLGERLEGGDEVAFEPVPVDAEPVQRTVVLLGLEQGERDVLGPDVVVPQAKRLTESQFERLLRGPLKGIRAGGSPSARGGKVTAFSTAPPSMP